GACDIIAESISDDADYRTWIREKTFKNGRIISKAKDDKAESVYENYYDYDEAIAKLPGHRILALNRGEKEKLLKVSIEAPVEDILRYLEKKVISRDNVNTNQTLQTTIEDAYTRLIAPSIENEIRNNLTEMAEDGAIKVFGKNLTQLLMQPPIAGRNVLGWDPAFRTGCKIAVVDATGKVLDTTVVYPTAPQNKVEETKKVIKALIKKYNVSLISLGNGTASRESEQIIVDMLKEIPEKVEYVIVNEAGASVYSASKLATEEFPNFDVGQRSATSMARRLQDPLAELVKIDPKSVGVGQYQHDMNQKKLDETLAGVVETCVNAVGVDLNTASASLLEYVSGINKTLAKNIVEYREENGRFNSRAELKKVPKLGPKAFEQCAGFMRIIGGKNPLDSTAVHPESYDAAKALLEKLGFDTKDIAAGTLKDIHKSISDIKKLSTELGIGEMTLEDIIKELEKPGRDPREDMPRPILKSDVLEMKDLKPGMQLKGTVRNVIDFGAFVDIGVHQDGLVHISQMTDRYIKHPLEVVSVGDIVDVEVLSVDEKKGRISLTMKLGKSK
ncbi:MAG: RNA-binding transcriptional accessory protein, partial [Pseudobutyrivibrio sp.]|nr:RNA-binding transcriptional accessory protein [Pseudobutyrivibrio sp.]